jgi:hypothetical protein
MSKSELLKTIQEDRRKKLKEDLEDGKVLDPQDLEYLEGELATLETKYGATDGSSKSVEQLMDKTVNTIKKRPQAGGMQTGFTMDWTGVYKPILTVFNGGKRKGRRSTKRKSKSKKYRKSTRKMSHRK